MLGFRIDGSATFPPTKTETVAVSSLCQGNSARRVVGRIRCAAGTIGLEDRRRFTPTNSSNPFPSATLGMLGGMDSIPLVLSWSNSWRRGGQSPAQNLDGHSETQDAAEDKRSRLPRLGHGGHDLLIYSVGTKTRSKPTPRTRPALTMNPVTAPVPSRSNSRETKEFSSPVK